MIDHIVYATADLDSAVARIAELLGVEPEPGGAHPGKGTRNFLVNLAGRSYLEIIGPDPDQPDHRGERPFGIDAIIGGHRGDGVVAWCARAVDDLEATGTRLRSAGIGYGPVTEMSRSKPDGTQISWTLMVPEVDELWAGIPFFIDWGATAHPTDQLPSVAVLHTLAVPPTPYRGVLDAAVGDDPRLAEDATVERIQVAVATDRGVTNL